MTDHRLPVIRSVESVVADLTGDRKGRILVAVAAGWFLSIGLRYSYPALLPFFRADLGLSLTLGGLLLSALWTSYAIGQFPGGILVDRVGVGNILVISTAISAVAVLFVATSTTVTTLFVGTIAFGLATSLYGPARFLIFTEIYAERAGTAVGLSHASGSVGNTVLPVVTSAIASYASWRAGYGALVPFFVGITFALWLWVPGRTGQGGPSAGPALSALSRRLLSNVSRDGIPVVAGIQILIVFVSQGFTGFYPTYLISVKGFSPEVAALTFGVYFAAGILIQPITGLSNDRFGPKATLMVLIALYSAGLFALFVAESLLHILLVTVVLSHRNGTGVVTNTFIADSLADDVKGAGLGFLRMVWILIGATGPIFVGYLGDLGLLARAYLVLAVLACLALGIAAFMPSR